jgi:hypothetical protein
LVAGGGWLSARAAENTKNDANTAGRSFMGNGKRREEKRSAETERGKSGDWPGEGRCRSIWSYRKM